MSTPTRGEAINTWTQTVAIVCAGLWALYTFAYKEVVIPRSAEGSIDADLNMSIVGASPTHFAVALTVVARNPSPKRVHLLPSAFFVWGTTYGPRDLKEEEFYTKVQKNLRESSDHVLSRSVKRDQQSLVASGRMLTDFYFNPSESASQTVIFHVPKGTYDTIDAYVLLPQAHSIENLRAEWTASTESRAMDLYEQADKEGKWIKVDKNDASFRARTGYGTSTAHKMLCLWPPTDPSTAGP